MPERRPGPGAASLLSQVGAAAATRYGEAIAELDLTPPQAALLRHLAAAEPVSQHAIAQHLGTAPSRVVDHVDALERRGIVRRDPGPDRRVKLVSLTPDGVRLVAELRDVARRHDAAVTRDLSAAQCDTLVELLGTVAGSMDLTPGAH